MSVKNNKTSTKIVIHYTESQRDAERKFPVKYSARTLLLILLGKSFAYFWRVSDLAVLDRPPQDVAVLDFEIPCSRPETSGFHLRPLLQTSASTKAMTKTRISVTTQSLESKGENEGSMFQDGEDGESG